MLSVGISITSGNFVPFVSLSETKQILCGWKVIAVATDFFFKDKNMRSKLKHIMVTNLFSYY